MNFDNENITETCLVTRQSVNLFEKFIIITTIKSLQQEIKTFEKYRGIVYDTFHINL